MSDRRERVRRILAKKEQMAGRADAVRNERFYRSRIRKLEAALRDAIYVVDAFFDPRLEDQELLQALRLAAKPRSKSWQQLIDDGKPS